MATYDEADLGPLDPAAAALRRKLVRLLFVSGGIMILGLIAVFAAIVYKLDTRGGARAAFSSGKPIDASIDMPAGAKIVATALDGDRALLTITAADGSSSLLLVDLASGTILGRYALGPR